VNTPEPAASSARHPFGICELAWPGTDLVSCARQAAGLGFAHLDVVRPVRADADLPIALGARFGPGPGRGWAWPAPPAGADWDDAVEQLRRCPHPRVEPWAGSLFGADAAIERLVEAVPEVRLVLDTGHVAQWGGDPLAYVHLADHVQFRQAARGVGQLPWDQGDVDFAAVLARLRAIDYSGMCTVEYFDLPALGWPFADPVGAALGLADHLLGLVYSV
jgi:hypothetical protein